MDKKPYHHGNLEEALIEAGLALVDKEGIEAMSLRKVAAACGVSHAAPYKHFAGKEELLAAMSRYVEERFASALQQAYDNTNGDKMLEMGKEYIGFFLENPHYFSFFQRQQGDYLVNLDNLDEASNYRPFEVFRRGGVQELDQHPLPPNLRAQTIIAMWAMVHGATSVAVMNGVRYSGNWRELLGSMLQYNLGAGGNHFENK